MDSEERPPSLLVVEKLPATLRRGNSHDSVLQGEKPIYNFQKTTPKESPDPLPTGNIILLEWWPKKQFPQRLSLFSSFDTSTAANQLCEVIMDKKQQMFVRGAALVFLTKFISCRKILGSGDACESFTNNLEDIFKEFALVHTDVVAVKNQFLPYEIQPVIKYVFKNIASLLGSKLVDCWSFVNTHVCAPGLYFEFVDSAMFYLPTTDYAKEVYRQLAFENIVALRPYAKNYKNIDEKVILYHINPSNRPEYEPFDVPPLQYHTVFTMVLPWVKDAFTLCQITKTCKWLYNQSNKNTYWEPVCKKLRIPSHIQGSFKQKYQKLTTLAFIEVKRTKILMSALRYISNPKLVATFNSHHNMAYMYEMCKKKYHKLMASQDSETYAQFLKECGKDIKPEDVYKVLVSKSWHHKTPVFVEWLCSNYPKYKKDAKQETIRYLFFQKGDSFLEFIESISESNFVAALKEDSEFRACVMNSAQFVTKFISTVSVPAMLDPWQWYDCDIISMLRLLPDEKTKVDIMYRRLTNSDHQVLNLRLISELGKYKYGYELLKEFKLQMHPKGKKHARIPNMEKYEAMIESSPYYQPKECLIC